MKNKKIVKAACAVTTVAVVGASSVSMLHAADKVSISYDMTYLTVKLNGRTIPSGSSVNVGDTVIIQAAGKIGSDAASTTYGIYANGQNIYSEGMESASYTVKSSDSGLEFTVDSALTREAGLPAPTGPTNPSSDTPTDTPATGNARTLSFNSDDISITNDGNPLINGSRVPVGATLTYEAGWMSSENVKSVTIAGTKQSGATGTYTVTENTPATITISVEFGNAEEPPAKQGKTLSFNSDDISITNDGNPLISGSRVPVGAVLTYQAGWRTSDPVKSVTIAGTKQSGATGTYTVTESSPETITITVEYGSNEEQPPVAEGKLLSFNADDISITHDGNPLISGSKVPVGAVLTYQAGWRTSDPVKSVTIAGTVYSGAEGTYTVTESSPSPITFSVEYKNTSTDPVEQKYQLSFNQSDVNVSVDGMSVSSGQEVTKSSQITVSPVQKTGYKVKDIKIVGTSTGRTSTFTFNIADGMSSPITIEVEYEAEQGQGQGQGENTNTSTASLVFDSSSITVTNGNTTLSSGSTLSGGERLTISVAEKNGYTLSDLKINGASYGALRSAVFDVPSNLAGMSQIKIEAVYTEKSSNPSGSSDTPTNNTDPGNNTSKATATLFFDSSSVAVTGNNGSLSSGSPVTSGDKLTITVADKTGYTLTNVSVNGVSYGPSKSLVLNVPDLSGISQISIEASYTRNEDNQGGNGNNDTPANTDQPTNNQPINGQSYFVTFSEDISVTKYGDVVKSGDAVKEGDVLRITAFRINNTLTSLKVNGTAIANASLYTVDGTGNVNITASFSPISDNNGQSQNQNSENQQSGTTTTPTNTSQQGTSYTTPTYTVSVNVTDSSTRRAVAGARVSIYGANRGLLATYTTDSYGNISTRLAPGTYYYHVVSAPNGYVVSDYDHQINVYDNGNITGDFNITLDSGAVTLTRKDPVSGAGIGGSTITIRDSSGSVVTTATSDSSGKYTITGLKPGTYTYTETSAAPGYGLDTSTYSFTVRNDGTATGTLSSNAEASSVILYVKDSETDKAIAGVTVTIYDSNGNAIKNVTTDASGRIIISSLGSGSYTFKVTGGIPSGYESTSETGSFTLSGNTLSGNTVVHLKATSSSEIYSDNELRDVDVSDNSATVIPVNTSSSNTNANPNPVATYAPVDGTGSGPVTTSIKTAGPSVKTGVTETVKNTGKIAAIIGSIGATLGAVVMKKKRK